MNVYHSIYVYIHIHIILFIPIISLSHNITRSPNWLWLMGPKCHPKHIMNDIWGSRLSYKRKTSFHQFRCGPWDVEMITDYYFHIFPCIISKAIYCFSSMLVHRSNLNTPLQARSICYNYFAEMAAKYHRRDLRRPEPCFNMQSEYV